jgi:flagellar basal body P-ring formation protein FlgA
MSRIMHIAVLVLVPLFAWGDPGRPGSVRVDGAWILLSDLVPGCDAPSCQVTIAPAPSPGQVRIVRREEIAQAIASAGFDGRAIRLPEARRVARSTRRAAGEEIGEAVLRGIEAVLPEGLVVEKMEPFGAVPVPATGYRVAVQWPGAERFERRMSIPVDLAADDVPFRSLRAVVTLAARLHIVIASRDLAASTVIAAGDVEEKVALFDVPPTDVAQRAEDVLGRSLRRPIAKGASFAGRDLESVPLVRRGQEVNLVAHAGLVLVTVAAVAREDGAVGERIRVASSSSGSLVWARVLAPGRAEVCP